MNPTFKNLPGNILNNNKPNYLKSGTNFHKQGTLKLKLLQTLKKNDKKTK